MAFDVRLVCALASVVALLSLPYPSSAQGFNFDPPGPFEFSVPADTFAAPHPVLVNIGDTSTQPFPFKYVGVQFVAGTADFVVVSPSSGTAPGVNVGISINPNVAAYLPPGGYSEYVLFAPLGQPSLKDGVQVFLTVTPPPPVVTSIVNSASLQPSISPGALVSIFGANLGTPPVPAQYNDSGLYPATLGNTTVTFNGTVAALLYVSTTQINAVVPYEVAGQKTVSVIVTHDSVTSPVFSVPLMDTSPAIFTILNDDPNANPTNSADKPAAEGSLISI